MEEIVEVPEGITVIQGMDVYDQFAIRMGSVTQVGMDQSLSPMLLIKADDGTVSAVSCSSIRTIGQIILLGPPKQDDCVECDPSEATPPKQDDCVECDPSEATPPKQDDCPKCETTNAPDSKFCEECGNDLSC